MNNDRVRSNLLQVCDSVEKLIEGDCDGDSLRGSCLKMFNDLGKAIVTISNRNNLGSGISKGQ